MQEVCGNNGWLRHADVTYGNINAVIVENKSKNYEVNGFSADANVVTNLIDVCGVYVLANDYESSDSNIAPTFLML